MQPIVLKFSTFERDVLKAFCERVERTKAPTEPEITARLVVGGLLSRHAADNASSVHAQPAELRTLIWALENHLGHIHLPDPGPHLDGKPRPTGPGQHVAEQLLARVRVKLGQAAAFADHLAV